jgi:hypothetical protein
MEKKKSKNDIATVMSSTMNTKSSAKTEGSISQGLTLREIFVKSSKLLDIRGW